MTRKDFELLAECIRNVEDNAVRRLLVYKAQLHCAKVNRDFDSAKFQSACEPRAEIISAKRSEA